MASAPLAKPKDVGAQSSGESSANFRAVNVASTPPYWTQHRRRSSNVSYTSVTGPNERGPIVLEDHTDPESVAGADASLGLWARSASIEGYVIVSGSLIGTGAYVVWECVVETLHGGPVKFRKRYSEFDKLRSQLLSTFPKTASSLPSLPPKSTISRFRAPFLQKRREGLQYFLNCVLLNPEFAGSPVLKDFIFSRL